MIIITGKAGLIGSTDGPRLRLAVYWRMNHQRSVGKTIERSQGLQITYLEEITYRHNWFDSNEFASPTQALAKNGYGQYQHYLLKETVH